MLFSRKVFEEMTLKLGCSESFLGFWTVLVSNKKALVEYSLGQPPGFTGGINGTSNCLGTSVKPLR
jgi:hypothetical protein